jgi:hypothetical protein
MSRLAIIVAAGLIGQLQAATLEQLSMDEMIAKSTAIVRGKVSSSAPFVRNSIIYTCYNIQVSEALKGTVAGQTSVCVAGGASQGLRQTYSGAPDLTAGTEYVLFLWAGKSGMNQLIGLTQGLFTLARNSAGETVLSRPASVEPMFDSSGRAVADKAVSLRLRDLSARIASAGIQKRQGSVR